MTPVIKGIVACGDDGELGATAFWRRVNTLVAQLKAHPGKRFALACDTASALAAGLIALNHAKRTIIVPPMPQADSLRACDADVAAVVTDRPDAFDGFETMVVPHAPDEAAPSAALAIYDDGPIEFYTSGSSEVPTCVRQDFRMMRLELEAFEREWGEQLGDAMFACTVSHYHRFGLAVAVVWPLLTGRTFYEKSCPTPGELRAAVGSRDCVIISSPAFLRRMNNQGELPPEDQVAALFSSGALLPEEIAERLANNWGQAVIDVYGSTETGAIGWRTLSTGARWRPLNGVEIELRSEAAGERLWMRAPYTKGWMPSGDFARKDADAHFELRWRADRVVKIADTRVSLDEMGHRLRTHPAVVDAYVAPLHGHRKQVGAVVMLDVTARATVAQAGEMAMRTDLQAWLHPTFAPIVIPGQWRFVKQWPDNDMSKVTQATLRGLFEESQ